MDIYFRERRMQMTFIIEGRNGDIAGFRFWTPIGLSLTNNLDLVREQIPLAKHMDIRLRKFIALPECYLEDQELKVPVINNPERKVKNVDPPSQER